MLAACLRIDQPRLFSARKVPGRLAVEPLVEALTGTLTIPTVPVSEVLPGQPVPWQRNGCESGPGRSARPWCHPRQQEGSRPPGSLPRLSSTVTQIGTVVVVEPAGVPVVMVLTRAVIDTSGPVPVPVSVEPLSLPLLVSTVGVTALPVPVPATPVPTQMFGGASSALLRPAGELKTFA